MELVYQLLLLPQAQQAGVLLETIDKFHKACNAIAEVAYREICRDKVKLQKLVYFDTRREFKLPAQLTIRAIATVVEAYKLAPGCRPYFAAAAPVVLDRRLVSFRGLDKANLATLHGRCEIGFCITGLQCVDRDRPGLRGRATLVHWQGEFRLTVGVDLDPLVDGGPYSELSVKGWAKADLGFATGDHYGN